MPTAVVYLVKLALVEKHSSTLKVVSTFSVVLHSRLSVDNTNKDILFYLAHLWIHKRACQSMSLHL